MGAPKAGLRAATPGDTLLSLLIRTLLAAGLPDIIIVTGAAPDAVHRAAGRYRRPVRFEHNERWAEGQLTSLQAGLRERSGDLVEAVLVSLVDAPFASASTIAHLIDIWRRQRAPIVRPARGHIHGHPAIFDRAVFADLHAVDPRLGAKAVVRAHAPRLIDVPVDDPGAFIDVDTPDEYEHALRQLRR
jgi:CTP:molybdopterin cytidylyltransferase MocA